MSRFLGSRIPDVDGGPASWETNRHTLLNEVFTNFPRLVATFISYENLVMSVGFWTSWYNSSSKIRLKHDPNPLIIRIIDLQDFPFFSGRVHILTV